MPPSIFYSYRPARADLERESQVLLENQIWFSTPDQFNDPFELRPYFHFPEGYKPSEEVIEAFVALVPQAWRGIASTEIRGAFSNSGRLKETANRIKRELFAAMDQTSIACFAETPTDIRMWSYYASSHRGICLGFSFDEPWIFSHPIAPEQVVYRRELPKIPLEAVTDVLVRENLRRDCLLTKAEEWAGEKEWRCLRYMTPSGHQRFPPFALHSIVFGARIEPQRRANILALLKQRSIPIQTFQAKTAEDRFELELRRLEG